MAPYVRHEWGEKATDMMWRIKKLADPHGVLAPNVILTRDDGINLKSFKSAPPIEDVAVHCIECGFCEAVCPSRNITTTPAAADRAAPRDGPPARRVSSARPAAG
jgi:D-lactate dehydrogenase